MIIWINGPFGGGKTTLSEELKTRLPNNLVFDPEEIGFTLRRLVPLSPTGDFQDLPIWRSLTLYALREVRRLYEKTIIVPMALVNPDYISEIVGGLTEAEEDIFHIFLELDEEILRSRITAQVLSEDPTRDQQAREWRLAQVNRCLAARNSMPAGTIFLNSGVAKPSELADEIIAMMPADLSGR